MADRKPLQRLVADWPAKVLSLVTALLLFVFYNLNRLEDRFVSVPLGVTLSDDYVPSTVLPRGVRLTLRGEARSIVTILEDDLKASVDFSRVRAEGVTKASVVVERRGSALGIDPLEIVVEPAEVLVNLERKVRKVVPVTPSFRGYPEPGYEMSTFGLTPAEAEVTGPASAVSRVVDLSTEFIELTGRTVDFTTETRVFSRDPLVSVVGLGTASFHAEVRAAIDYRKVEGFRPKVTGLEDGLVLASPLPSCTIRLQASKALLADYQPAEDLVIIDLANVRRPGVYTFPLFARLPEGFALDSLDPESVTIRIAAGGGNR
ncbi:MAG: YbbR-like domain-containing protein [Rectinemataceae bacterium]